MPFPSARLMGASKAFLSTTAIAIPSALELIAALKALIIWPTSAVADPVHVYVLLTSAPASAAPYFVGTKNEFVVALQLKENFQFVGAVVDHTTSEGVGH